MCAHTHVCMCISIYVQMLYFGMATEKLKKIHTAGLSTVTESEWKVGLNFLQLFF